MHKPKHQMPNRRSRWGSWLWYGMFNIAAHTAPQQYVYAVLLRYTVQTYMIVLGDIVRYCIICTNSAFKILYSIDVLKGEGVFYHSEYCSKNHK